MKRIILMLILGVLPVAVNADSLESWGEDDYNQVTDTPIGNDFHGVILGINRPVIAGGGYHSAALASDGSIESWGLDNHVRFATMSGVGFKIMCKGEVLHPGLTRG